MSKLEGTSFTAIPSKPLSRRRSSYDQNSFDRNYDTLPLEAFEPAVRSIFAAAKKSIYVSEAGTGGLGAARPT